MQVLLFDRSSGNLGPLHEGCHLHWPFRLPHALAIQLPLALAIQAASCTGHSAATCTGHLGCHMHWSFRLPHALAIQAATGTGHSGCHRHWPFRLPLALAIQAATCTGHSGCLQTLYKSLLAARVSPLARPEVLVLWACPSADVSFISVCVPSPCYCNST